MNHSKAKGKTTLRKYSGPHLNVGKKREIPREKPRGRLEEGF